MNKKITDLQLKKAKAFYMNYMPISEIASRVEAKRTSLQYYVDKEWRSERVLRSTEIAANFSEAKLSMMNSTFSTSFKALQEWVRLKAQDVSELKAHEAKTMMSIIGEMDKIMRLDAGSPTDIIAETVPVDVIEIRKRILAHDPFLLDADFKEIENDKKNTN